MAKQCECPSTTAAAAIERGTETALLLLLLACRLHALDSSFILLLPRGSQGYTSLLRDFLIQQQSISDSLVTSGRKEVHVEVDGRQEIVDAFTRGGQLLLLSDECRSLDSFHQRLLTGCTLRHRMPLLCVLLLMRLKMRLVIDAFATDVAGEANDLKVNRLDMLLQMIRP